MGASASQKRLSRIVLFACVLAVTYWICTIPAKSERGGRGIDENPPMFVLQVGIGKYKHAPTWAELRGAVTDVVEMRKLLEGERWKVPPANIVTLTDGQGTKGLIFEKFQTHLIAKAREHNQKTKRRDAVVVFQFSGHGSQAPDTDGDERDDGKDETLVTHDSDDAPGRNFDITDDEIYALTAQLRPWTDNIVYIFDSCHSGSGTRDSEDVRRLPERKSVPVPVAGIGTSTRSGPDKKEDGDSALMPPGDDYIVITAARAGELASQKYCFEECGSATTAVVYGNLTFYLIDELKNARKDTSYRELMENVRRRVVAKKPTQTPQLEGKASRPVFGSLGKEEDNFIRITGPETKKPNGTRTVTIGAGAMQGVTVGTVVSIYDKAISRFDGAQTLASGTVGSVRPGESTVDLVMPKRSITVEDKAVIVSPDLGSLRLKVDLDVDAAKFSADEKKVIALARQRLTPPFPNSKSEVELVTTRAGQPPRWDVAVLKDKFSNVASQVLGATAADLKCETPGKEQAGAEPDGRDREVLYLAGRDFVPLYRFCMESSFTDAASQAAAANRIEKALVHLSGLRSVSSISNKRSALNGLVTVTPIRLVEPFDCVKSVFTAGGYQPSLADPKTGLHSFAPSEVLWFEVANSSSLPLYVTLVNLKPDGSVELFTPRNRSDEAEGVIVPARGKRILMSDACRKENGEWLEAGPIRINGPSGVDRYKFIFSVGKTTRADFEYLEMPSFAKRQGGRASLASLTDWTTVDTVLQISDVR